MENEKIKEKIKEIKRLSFDDRHFELNGHVEIILNYLYELIKISDNEENKQKYESIWKKLDHTKEKEIKLASLDFIQASKRNAPYIRISEYKSSLKQAIIQVEIDLSYFIN